MNTPLLQRLSYLAVLPLCTLMVLSAARGAVPAAAPDPAASAASVVDDAREHGDDAREQGNDDRQQSDWQDQSARHGRHSRHNHHGHGNDLISIGHDSTLPTGEQADSVVSIFGSATSDGEAGEVVSVLGDTRVTGPVHDGAVAVLGSVYIDSKVQGDAVAVLGNMELGPHAEIGGDVVAVGGTLHRDPAAVIHGEIQNLFSADLGGAGGLRSWVHHCLLYGRPLAFAPGLGWAWTLALSCLALYVFLALLFREGLFRCVETFETQPGQAVLAALITMLLTPVLVVLLCVTVIGIAAVPFVVAALFCAGLFGKAVMLAWLGRRVTGKQTVGPMSHPAVAVLIGGAIVLVLYVIPVLGFLVYKLLGLLGLGTVVYTLIRITRAHQAAKNAPQGPAAPRTPPPLSGAAPTPGPAPTPDSAATTAAASMSSAAAASSSSAAPDQSGPPPAAPGPAPAEAPHAGQAPPAITAALPRAGFWVRMAALLIDALLVGFALSVLNHHHLELLVLATYGAVMWKLRGATIGGLVFDLQIVRLDGRAIDWETAIVRALSCFLSLAVAGLGFIWIVFDDNKQAWHDKIAGTVVVRVAKGVPLV